MAGLPCAIMQIGCLVEQIILLSFNAGADPIGS